MLTAGFVLPVVSINAQTLTLAGTIEASMPGQQLVQSFPPPSDAVDGSISSWVVNDSALDPGGYTFIYQVVNSGAGAVGDVELNGFSSSDILSTATYSSETGLTLTGALTPSADGNFSRFNLVGGDAATFESGNLPSSSANNVSYFLVINTDAATVADAYGRADGGFTAYGNISTVAVGVVPVPEPSSLALLACFACLYGMARYRQAAAATRQN